MKQVDEKTTTLDFGNIILEIRETLSKATGERVARAYNDICGGSGDTLEYEGSGIWTVENS